jgi:predicted nucleic acid-binding protein
MFRGTPRQMAIDVVREASRFFSELVPSAILTDRALAIALELRHSVYDCFYVALADLREVDFVTADAQLLRRCANSTFATRIRVL